MRVSLDADVLHPGDDLAALVGLLHGQMDHGMAGRGAVPVLLAGSEPGGVAGREALDLAAFSLCVADAADDEEHLSARVSVPRGAGSGRERDDSAALGRRVVGAEHRLNPHFAVEPVWPAHVVSLSLLHESSSCLSSYTCDRKAKKVRTRKYNEA